MQPWQRAEYLKALGIDVWVPRHAPAAAALEAAAAPASPAGVQPAAQQGPPPESASASAAGPSSVTAPVRLPEAPPVAPREAAAAVPVQPQAVDSTALAAVWESLRAEVLACTKCPLHGSRTQGVFGVGSREAQLLVIGEAPGAEEDRKGEPFVGRAGQLLDSMLHAIGFSRDSNVYIANVLKSRPPNNRDPQPQEVAACIPYLKRQIALLNPKLMLAVGRIAAQNLLGTGLALGRLRGQVHHFGELNTPLIVTYHPAYLLRSPAEKRKAWEDLKFARRHFRQLVNGSIDGHRS
jgi:uracil-DNA glycosylase